MTGPIKGPSRSFHSAEISPKGEIPENTARPSVMPAPSAENPRLAKLQTFHADQRRFGHDGSVPGRIPLLSGAGARFGISRKFPEKLAVRNEDALQRLLARLRDNPLDSATLGVLQDLLLERGHPQAETIALSQKIRETNESGSGYLKDLLHEKQSTFERNILEQVGWEISPGRESGVYIDAGSSITPFLWQDGYIIGVSLPVRVKLFEAISQSDAGTFLRTLTFNQVGRYGNFSLPDFSEFFQSPYLKNIRELNFAGGQFDRNHIKIIATSPHLENLTRSFMIAADVDDSAVKTIVESPYLKNLRDLHLEAAFDSFGSRFLFDGRIPPR